MFPKDMWEKYVDAPKTTKPKQDRASRKKVKDDWCKPEIRKALCRGLTVLQRYCLWKASHLGLAGIKKRQVAEIFSIQKLFEIHYHLVGQFLAAKQVIQIVTNHFLSGFRRPLILLFAGPSGHGKTELSRRMGDLLSLPLQYVDCTEMKHETDIFGPKPPYIGCNKSSPLNNFLIEHAGLKSIVFLDEFDKTTKEVRNSMLLTLDTGHYKSRVDGTPLDCSKVIWIMATNKGDEQIQRFWDEHLADAPEERQLSAPMHVLQSRLSRTLIDEFGPPLTGRLSAIIPFLPFTISEQAVVAFTFIRRYRNEVRRRIDVEAKQLVRHIHLNLLDDGQTARYIAKKGYKTELGARSLDREVVSQVEFKVTEEWLEVDDLVVDEVDQNRLFKYDVRVIGDTDEMQRVEVKRAGVTKLQRREDGT